MKKNTTLKQSLSSTDVSACTTVAVDLAKQVFQVAGEDALGQVLYEERLKSREAFHAFLRKLAPNIVVLMETGQGLKLGHGSYWLRAIWREFCRPSL